MYELSYKSWAYAARYSCSRRINTPKLSAQSCRMGKQNRKPEWWRHACRRPAMTMMSCTLCPIVLKCKLTTRDVYEGDLNWPSMGVLYSLYARETGFAEVPETSPSADTWVRAWKGIHWCTLLGEFICVVVVVGNTHPQVQISQMHCSLTTFSVCRFNLLRSLLSLMMVLSWIVKIRKISQHLHGTVLIQYLQLYQ